MFHLCGVPLGPGSIVKAGNWGRVVSLHGWRHDQALREAALESARLAKYPYRPSRLASAFCFSTAAEAKNFRAAYPGFAAHVLYEVTVADPTKPQHLVHSYLCTPQGPYRPNWAEVYWEDIAVQDAELKKMGVVLPLLLREIVTESDLVIGAVIP